MPAVAEALVINLDRTPARLVATRASLQGAGFAVERVVAVDALEEPDADSYDKRRNARDYFAPLKPAEIACFRSHRRAWRRVLETGRPMLVCEDDVEADADLAALVDALEARLSGAAAVKLYAPRPVLGPFEPLLQRRLIRPRIVPLGCVAVWLTPEGARGLLARSERFHSPVDVYTQEVWTHGVPTWCVSPPPVREVSDRLGGSTLSPHNVHLAARLSREVRRPFFRASLALRSLWETR